LSVAKGTFIRVVTTRVTFRGFGLSRIFDNIDLHLGNHLQSVISDYDKLDAAVGYFNLRGWQFFAPIVDSKPLTKGSPVARILVGMSGVDPDQAITDFLQSSVNGSVATDGIDGSVARERRQQAIFKFREQLSRGILDRTHYEALQTLKRHLEEGRVQIKLFTRRPLHGKTYICHREDVTNPITAFVGSSNLTMSGLQHNYELNVDVVDWDGTKVLAKWFEDRWSDRYTIEITSDLIELIQESWAGDVQPTPYDVYLKVCWHLSRDVRDGLAEYGVPTALQSELLDYQSSAVKTLARRIATRGGAMLGDVVGLGKSITATAVAMVLKEEYGWDTLIICPKNLEEMWQKEYSDAYELNARVVPYSMVTRILPDLRRYRFVIVDESHTMRSDSRQDYIQLKDYIQRNDSKVLLLTATPFNIRFKDVANQLGLFLDDDTDLGLQPTSAMALDAEFAKKLDHKTTTLAAFKKSDEADDWKRLMSEHLIRRTRTFIKNNYAIKDEKGNEYLTFSNGEKFYFPQRIAKPIEHSFDNTDPARLMVSDETLDEITDLKLPRYGLARYVNSKYRTTTKEDELIQKWEKSSGHLSGFVRTGLFKRLSSCGTSFVISLQRHLARNEMWIYALEKQLPIPVGSVLESMLDPGDGDFTTLEEDNDLDLVQGINTGQAKSDYETLKRKNPSGVEWVHPEIFTNLLRKDLDRDTNVLKELLGKFGQVNEKNDSKLKILFETIASQYKSEKVLIFTEYADTAEYVAEGLKKLGLMRVESVTGNNSNPTDLARRFSPRSNHKLGGDKITLAEEIQILVSTDVLSEGQNLQDAAIVVNYDLPWAIIRLIQRAGRVDRVGQTSPTVEILSFFHETIENVISLRERIRHRLSQNASAFGSDEKFFGTKDETAIIEGLYSGDLPSDGSESDNDASSLAYQIWTTSKRENPERAARVERMNDLVFTTRPARNYEFNSVGVFVRTDRGMDGFGYTTGDEYRLMTAYEALKYFECEPTTPTRKMLPEHFSWVQGLVHSPLQQPSIIAGQMSGIRKRVYKRLKSNLTNLPLDVAKALEAIYSRPLTAEAEGRLRKALTARSDEDLGSLISALHSDERLVITDDLRQDPIRIVCSMGVNQSV
jgi:superfamily II DNA or RNA helicase